MLTVEQVLGLAPDAASAKAGQGLANPAKWISLGFNSRSAWGECQGSGKNPYRTQADLTGPAFNCSCPSRKFPCKHGLGLLLLLASNSARIEQAPAPPWVSEWISKRDAANEKKTTKLTTDAAGIDPETAARREADREKRAAKRQDRVRAGVEELQTWLGDLARQGLAHAKQHPAQFFDAMAARMIDAQAPGISRRLRELPGIFASGDDWAGRALTTMGSLQLLIHGFTRNDAIPDGLRASVRNAIGWTVADADLATAESVRDSWQVVGQVLEEEDKLRVQRTWLVGEASQRPALCLSFAAANQPLDVSLIAGTAIEADVAFYPSGSPLRAFVTGRHGEIRSFNKTVASPDFAAALEQTATLLAGDPWLERTPWLVSECLPLRIDDSWHLRDTRGAVSPLVRNFANAWPLFALSGGSPVTVFGEWNGREILPLSVIAESGFVALGGNIA